MAPEFVTYVYVVSNFCEKVIKEIGGWMDIYKQYLLRNFVKYYFSLLKYL